MSSNILCLLSHIISGMAHRPFPRDTLSNNLRHLMGLEGLNTYDVSKRSGVSQRTVVNILNGTSSASIDTVDKIAKSFGLNLWHIIMPGLPEDLGNNSSIARLYRAYQDTDMEGRELIVRMAEREASHSKTK